MIQSLVKTDNDAPAGHALLVQASDGSPALFTPLKVGPVTLSHRVAMAPLTRCRADNDNVPTKLMETHYAQRATVPGTLLITEATLIAAKAGGYPNVPGVWSDAQVEGWKKVNGTCPSLPHAR